MRADDPDIQLGVDNQILETIAELPAVACLTPVLLPRGQDEAADVPVARQDGQQFRADRDAARLAWLNRCALLPYGLLAHSVWLLSSKLSKEPAWQRIDERLIVGRRLLDSEVPGDIDAVLDLACEFQETPRLRQANYTCLPMLDASAIEVVTIAEAVEKAAARPGALFVHCAQGHGRTGLIAALVLAKRTPGMTPREALARLQSIRPGIGLSRQQLAVLDVLQATEGAGKPEV
jgi:hypothetical protein